MSQNNIKSRHDLRVCFYVVHYRCLLWEIINKKCAFLGCLFSGPFKSVLEKICARKRSKTFTLAVYATTSHRQHHFFEEKNFYWDNSLQRYEKSYPFNVCTESAEMKENWEPQGCVFSVFSLNRKIVFQLSSASTRKRKIQFGNLANFNLPLREVFSLRAHFHCWATVKFS